MSARGCSNLIGAVACTARAEVVLAARTAHHPLAEQQDPPAEVALAKFVRQALNLQWVAEFADLLLLEAPLLLLFRRQLRHQLRPYVSKTLQRSPECFADRRLPPSTWRVGCIGFP